MKSNKLKFFFVASALVSGFASTAMAEGFDFGGDVNASIASPDQEHFSSDRALQGTSCCNPQYPHSECCKNAANTPLNGLFETHGSAGQNGSKGAGSTQ